MLPKEIDPSRDRFAYKPKRSSETLFTGKEIFQHMIGMIGSAKKSIDLQFYTFEADTTGRNVLDALRLAKERNPDLQIRLLIDGSNDFRHDGGSVFFSDESRKKRDETYEIINNMKDEGIFDAKMTNWFSHNPFNTLVVSNMFHRDHKKLVIFDKDTDDPSAMITSVNVAKYHENARKELGRIYYGTDGPVPYLAKDFENSFKQAKEWEHVYSVRSIAEYIHKYGWFSKTLVKDAIGSVVRNPQSPGKRMVFLSGPQGYDSAVLTDSFWPKIFGKNIIGAREATNEGFTMLDNAQKGDRVIVFTPYPGMFSLTGHLIKAARRGIDVHLIISQNYEHEMVNPKNFHGPLRLLEPMYTSWPKRLARNGVYLHEYLGKKEENKGELHAKGVVWMRKDGSVRTLIGSTNFSKGSISGMNREIAVVEETDMSDPLVAYVTSLIKDSETHEPTKIYLRRDKRRKR